MAKTNPAQFVRQVRQEINRITWATRRETLYASLSVLVMALIASLFFLLVDLLLSSVVEFLLDIGS
jgi:preprotein translocase subunit SecE|tara:strand:- start:693 stop:890 length:198 start_codon:yes stop_codon:yes gene_type:complete